MQISIQDNVKEAKRYLSKVEKEQVPYAEARAINDTAFDVSKALKQHATLAFDNKKKWFNNKEVGIRVTKKAHKKEVNPHAIISTPAHFMPLHVTGGIKRPRRGKNLLIPVNVARGNQNARGPEKVLKQKGVFSTKTGIYKRVGGKKNPKLKLLYWRTPRAKIRKDFDYYGVASKTALMKFRANFDRWMAKAMATAR